MPAELTPLRGFLADITKPRSEDNQPLNRILVDRYIRHLLVNRGRTPLTGYVYNSLLGMWIDTLGDQSVLEATKQDMERFIQRPRLRRGAGTNGAPASKKRDADILRSFYKWAHEEGLTSSFLAVALHGPTVRNVNPRPIPDDVWLPVWTSKMSDEDRVMLGLGFYLGLRRAEITALRPAQITDEHIVNFIRKGGGEHALDWRSILTVYQARLGHLAVGLTDFTSALVRLSARGRTSPTALLLPYRNSGSALSRRLRVIQRPILGTGAPLWTPHQMRHSCATNLLRAGVPIHLVKEILNHSSIDITMRYVKAGGDELREWLRTAD